MFVGLGCLGLIFFLILLFIGASNDSGGLIFFSFIGMLVSAFGGNYLDKRRTANRILEEENDKHDLLMRYENEIKNKLENTNDFTVSQKYISVTREIAIAIDEERKLFCFIVRNSSELGRNKYAAQIYSYSDILKSEIISNGTVVLSTTKNRSFEGMLVGGALGGGAGAVIGGVLGGMNSISRGKSLNLTIVVNDTKNTSFKVPFLLPEAAVATSSQVYIEAEKSIEHWHNLISYVIKKDGIDSERNSTNKIDYSVTDEILKLSQLLKEDLITKDEFEDQKKKILQNS